MAQNPLQLRTFTFATARKALLLAFALSALIASAQSQEKPPLSILPKFDVATVKANRSPDANNERGYWKAAKGDQVKITLRNGTLLTFIEQAFGMKEYQITGPDWLKKERFDIVAIASHVNNDQLRPMLQELLKERFKLEVHRESKVLPVYALVPGKSGAKIQAVKAEGDSGVWGGVGKLTVKKLSMAHFAETLSGQMDRPVLDMTGLDGVYDFTLQYTPETQPQVTGDGQSPAAPDLAAGPSIFTALQEQLGLKLESRKAPVEILVIDHAEKEPTEN
jgi:uncharacterized protein (TIGR03435 family)